MVKRICPDCGAEVGAMALRCGCGYQFPEAQDILSDPEEPRCAVCGEEIELLAPRCQRCGAEGYPGLRARRGRKTKGAP